MDISIIIPVKERGEILLRTLHSLYRQVKVDPLSIEIIIVDNGSKESIGNFLDKEQCPFEMKVIRANAKTNNRSYVRNTGIQAASGSVILFLDCDVMLLPDSLYQHYQCVKQDRFNVSIGYTFQSNKQPKTIPNTFDEVRGNDSYSRDRRLVFQEDNYTYNWQHAWLFAAAGNLAVSSYLVSCCHGFNETFSEWGCEDTEFGMNLMKHGAKFYFNKNAAGIHFPHLWISKNRQSFTRTAERLYQLEPCIELELLCTNRSWKMVEYSRLLENIKVNRFDGNIKTRADVYIGDHREINVADGIHIFPFSQEGYPLFGFKTPFESHTISTVLFLPSWRNFLRDDLTGLFEEGFRISRRVYIICLADPDEESCWDGTYATLKLVLAEFYSLRLIETASQIEVYEMREKE